MSAVRIRLVLPSQERVWFLVPPPCVCIADVAVAVQEAFSIAARHGLTLGMHECLLPPSQVRLLYHLFFLTLARVSHCCAMATSSM